jgi:serine/threonine-protein kinase HipA
MANQWKKIKDADEKQRNFSRLLKVILFNFLIGNSDGHLKNYSIFHRLENGVARFDLTPFYDILPIHLFARQDKDQLALTLNGKKRSIAKTDFQSLAVKLGIKVQTIDDFVSEFEANLPDYFETFRMFGVEEELLVIHEKYIEEQMALLR